MNIQSLLLLFFAASTRCLTMAMSTKNQRMPNPVIKVMAQGMGLLKPVFVAEAKLQAGILGSSIERETVSLEIETEIKSKPVVIYTYAISPFSTEALAMLDSAGADYKKIELGAEWFALGGKNSVKRVLLSEKVESGATSLPKVFVGGKCIGGCAELAEAIENGDFSTALKKKSRTPFSFRK